jgi:hypothetical protein
VLACEIVKTSRDKDPSTIRSVVAHVQIDVKDKEKVLKPDFWDSGVTVRLWRQSRRSWVLHNNDW